MSWIDWAKLIGGGAAVPFTGGATLPLALSGLGGVVANHASQTTTPTVAKEYGPLQAMVLKQMQQRLSQPVDMAGYGAQGIGNINHNFDLLKQSQGNALTARGLSTSPIAGNVDATREMGRVGAVTDFQNGLPLLARQMQGQDLGQATNLLTQGRGVTTDSSVGGGWAGAFNNMAEMLGYLYGSGKLGGAKGNGLPGFSAGPF